MADQGSTHATPLTVVVHNPAAIIRALEAVAQGRKVALLLAEQIPSSGQVPRVPARPLAAGAIEQARDLITRRPVDGDAATIAAAAGVLGVASWPAFIWSGMARR